MAADARAPRGDFARDAGPDQRVDHRIVSGLLDGWLLELDTNRNWQKNLMIYASAISDGVHNLMTMESAPADVRARRIIDKLKGVPALLDAATVNIVNPPRVMAERGVRMLRGASAMLTRRPAPRVRRSRRAETEDELEAAGATAAKAIDAFVALVREGKAAEGRRSLHGRPANLEARYRAEELIDLPARAAPGDRRARAGRRRKRRLSPRPRASTNRRRRWRCGRTC